MSLSQQVAKHFREIHFGGNWTCSNLEENLQGLTWQQATTKIYSCNSIAMLAYHVNYFVVAATKVLEGGPLDAHDKYSYDVPPINSQEDWERLVNKVLADAEKCVQLIGQLPDDKHWETFVEEKYGTYYRNLHGIIEHTHYHLGQIAILKKIVLQMEKGVTAS